MFRRPLSYPENFNVPLARKVLHQVTEHPETHNQHTWGNECGTKACIAGWTLILDDIVDYAQVYADARAEVIYFEPPTISQLARENLGLTRDEANSLFLNFNKYQVISRLRKMISYAAKKQAQKARRDAKTAARLEELRQQEIDAQARLQVATQRYHERALHWIKQFEEDMRR